MQHGRKSGRTIGETLKMNDATLAAWVQADAAVASLTATVAVVILNSISSSPNKP